MPLVFWLFVAHASDAALQVERGRLAVELGDPATAIELALDSLDDDPEARQLLAGALFASGQGARSLVELQATPARPLPWSQGRADLAGAVAVRDEESAITLARELLGSFPERPDLVTALWDVHAPSEKLERAQNSVVRKVAKQVRKRPDDVLYAYRGRRLLLAAGHSAEDAVAVLEQMGETGATSRGNLTRHQRTILAEQLTRAEQFVLPAGSRAEREDVADRAGELLMEASRPEEALVAWRTSPEGVESVEGRVRALLALGNVDDAVREIDENLAVVADPWPDDLANLDFERRARAMTKILEVRARAMEASHRYANSLIDQSLADLVSDAREASQLEDRVRILAAPSADTIAAQYRAPEAETALEAAESALADGAWEDAASHAQAALFLFAWGDMVDWRVECARLHAVQARALTELDQSEAARVAWQMALLTRPDADASWWSDAASVQRAAGHDTIAFAWHATAVSRDPHADEQPLEELHEGPAAAVDVARAVAVPVPVRQEVGVARVHRGATTLYGGAPVGEPVASGEGSAKPASSPTVGQQMPEWRVETDGGTITGAGGSGGARVLLFWSANCGSCLQAMHDTGDLARELRKSGRDVAVIAVSMDPEPRSFEELRQVERVHVALAHDPDLGMRLGVVRVPTLFVVDGNGVLQSHEVWWRGRPTFERTLRRAVAE